MSVLIFLALGLAQPLTPEEASLAPEREEPVLRLSANATICAAFAGGNTLLAAAYDLTGCADWPLPPGAKEAHDWAPEATKIVRQWVQRTGFFPKSVEALSVTSSGSDIMGLDTARTMEGSLELAPKVTGAGPLHNEECVDGMSGAPATAAVTDMCALEAAPMLSGAVAMVTLAADGTAHTGTLRSASPPETGEWTQLGTEKFAAAPVVNVADSDGKLELFGTAIDGDLMYARQGADGTWSNWAPMGIKVVGRVAVIGGGGGALFARSAVDNTLLQSTCGPDGRWSPFESLGGRVRSTPVALMDGDGSLHVFALGPDCRLYEKYQVATPPETIEWRPWRRHDALRPAPRAVVSGLVNSLQNIELYAHATDKSLSAARQAAAATGTAVDGEEALTYATTDAFGFHFGGSPTAYKNRDGVTEVFASHVDRSLWWTTQESADGASFGEWQSIGVELLPGTKPAVLRQGTSTVLLFVRPSGDIAMVQRAGSKGEWDAGVTTISSAGFKAYPC